MKIDKLDEKIKEVCPIFGINSNSEIWFKPEADNTQKAAAIKLMDKHLKEVE